MDYECSLYTIADTNLRKVSMSGQKLVVLDFLREDVSLSSVQLSKKFSRLIGLHTVFAIHVGYQ